ncbi:GNAT family N-acetyltransferase [Pseudomonas sp. NPDC089743]|uniref:GNAT family N-acetyltransferase n=1 Tax=Pseudomonas sp. NPDC089743 TaxID=3364471 RepID=UPI003823FD01
MRVERLVSPRLEHLTALSKLHVRAFPGFFLSSLGERFLNLLYKSYIEAEDCACFASFRETDGEVEIIGSIVVISKPAYFYKSIFRANGLRFAVYAIPSLLKNTLTVAKKLFSAVFYRGDADHDPEFSDAGLIASICVSPDAQGLGVGREMLKYAEGWAADRKLNAVFLLTDKDHNDAVNLFYVKNGYELNSVLKKSGGRLMNRYIKFFKG